MSEHERPTIVPGGLLSVHEFFTRATDDYCIAPNLEPHPPLAVFRDAIEAIERSADGTRVLFEIADVDDGAPVCDAILIVTPLPCETFTGFAAEFGADGVGSADRQTRGQIEGIGSYHVWRVPLD